MSIQPEKGCTAQGKNCTTCVDMGRAVFIYEMMGDSTPSRNELVQIEHGVGEIKSVLETTPALEEMRCRRRRETAMMIGARLGRNYKVN